jgi:hypothetical protein
MHRASVRNLTAQLEHRHSRPWRLTLANERKWTEYGLYFQFLEATGALLSHHEPAGCNSVLDLYHSVWQATEWYRDERKYDQHHFNPDVMTGYFIAVQSWLEPKYWLPSQYANADQFFASLRGFLGLDKL